MERVYSHESNNEKHELLMDLITEIATKESLLSTLEGITAEMNDKYLKLSVERPLQKDFLVNHQKNFEESMRDQKDQLKAEIRSLLVEQSELKKELGIE